MWPGVGVSGQVDTEAEAANKLSEFMAPGQERHTCATCPHIDTYQ